MTSGASEFRIERILVALDASPHSLAALAAATDLAAALGAELTGVFVEDDALVRMASLPFATEISFFSGEARALAPASIKRGMRAQAARARRALIRRASGMGLRWRFEVIRGDISERLLARSEAADIVILGRSSWTEGRRLGSTVRSVLELARRPILVLHRRTDLPTRILIVYDGSSAADQGLAAGTLLATQFGHGLSILILAQGEERANEMQSRAAERIKGSGLQADYRWLLSSNPHEFIRAVRSHGIIAILPAELAGLQGYDLTQVINQLESPVLVVHSTGDRE